MKWLLLPILYPPMLALTLMEAAWINIVFAITTHTDEEINETA